MRRNISLHLSNRRLIDILVLFLSGIIFGIIITSSIHLLAIFDILIGVFLLLSWIAMIVVATHAVCSSTGKSAYIYGKLAYTYTMLIVITLSLIMNIFTDLWYGALGNNTVNALNSVINSVSTGN